MCHWHSLYDSAYLRHLSHMVDVEIGGVQDYDPAIAWHRALELDGNVPTFTTFTDYRQMQAEVRPDFGLALGHHDTMTETARYMLDSRVPFIIENR